MKRILLILFLVSVLSVTAFAQVPNYKEKYVNDFANVLNVTQQNELRTLFLFIDQNTTAEMTLLTVETVAPMDTSQYAQEVFDKWKIGKADKDNGLLILYAKQENKIWVSTGYGLEGILPDSKIGNILDETFVPARANGDSASGIVLAANAYADVIKANADEVRSGTAGSSGEDISFFIVFFAVFFLMPVSLFISRYFSTPKCKKCKCRMKLVKQEVISKQTKGSLGITYDKYYTLNTYQCPKCNCKVVKKVWMQSGRYPIVFFGGGRGGGFSGGFGGGGFGGGGAGR